MKQTIAMMVITIVCVHCLFAVESQRDSAYLNILVNNDTTTQVQNEEQIIMNPLDSLNMVAVWRDFRVGYRQVAYGYTFDGGLTWGQDLFVEPQYIWDSDPGITVDTAGNFYAVILSFNSTSEPNGLFVYKSTDGGVTWSGPVTVINNVSGVFEDKELIACDRSSGSYTGNLYVTWARFYTTQILCSRSTDGGNSFVGPVTVSDQNGVQWPTPCVGPNSEVYIAWVRYSPGSIRFDKSTNGGQTFGTDVTVQNVSFVSGNIYGDITVFSFPAMDCDIFGGPYHGNIYVAFMDYSTGYTDTDIYFTRSTDGGISWSSKVRLNDDALNNGCDQFHPWLAVAPDGSITVVYLDRRLDPGNLLMDLYMTTSIDGGLTWSLNERITTVSSDPTAGSWPYAAAPQYPVLLDQPVILADRAGLLGEYIGVTASSIEDIHPIWTDTRRGHQDAFIAVKDTSSPCAHEHSDTRSPNSHITILPNPARDRVVFLLPSITSASCNIKIYNASGQFTAHLVASQHHATWDRRDDNGQPVQSGVYFLCVEDHEAIITQKFTLL